MQQPDRTLALHGELDSSTRNALAHAAAIFAQRCITEQHGNQRPTNAGHKARQSLTLNDAVTYAVIHAGALQFIDAASLGVLVTLHTTLAEGGIGLRTRQPTAMLHRISAICGLDGILGLEPTPTEIGSRTPASPRAATTASPRWPMSPTSWRRSSLAPRVEVQR